MRTVLATILMSALFCLSEAAAQQPPTKEYQSREHKIAIAFPLHWTLNPPVRNEVWLTSGQVRGVPVGCFVRVSIVRNLQLVEPEAYFRQTDEVGFGKLNSIATPDIRIHLFDFSYLGGRKARRIVYSGTDDGVKVGNLVHQTLDGNRIVTLTCFAEQQRFQLVYNELEAVAASLRFLK